MQHFNKPVAAICLAVASAFVQAQQTTYDFDIPAQPAGQVLDALAKQTGLQPFYAEGVVKGVRSPGVKGKLSLREALDKALAGTGLTYQFTGEKAVAIKAAEKTEKTMDAIVVSDTATRAEIPLDMPAAVGSRLGLTLRETPASVEIITRETMRERGETTTIQAITNATGISGGFASEGPSYSMRGFGGSISQLTQLNNGLRYPGGPTPPRSTFNYDRIEILKGPSSVLNGMGAIMGAINYVTKPADGRKEKELLLAYDSWNTRTVGVGIGDKASEQLAYRFDVSYMGADKGSMGFADRTSYENYHISGEMALAVTSNFKATLSAEWLKDQGEGYYGVPLVNGAILNRLRNNNYNVDDDRTAKDVSWYRLNLEWKLAEGVKLRNETYYNDEDRSWHNTSNYTYQPATGLVKRTVFSDTAHTQRYYGNRTDLTIDGHIGGMKNRLLAGFDYSRNEHQRNLNIPFGPGDTVSLENPVPGSFFSPTAQYAWRKTDVSNPALYVEDQLDLTERLHLALAARHDRVNVDAAEISLGTSFSKQYSGNSYRLGALYDLTPTVALYGQWSKSIEAPTTIVTLASGQSGYDLSQAKQIEIGVKADLPRKLGEITASVYKINRTNLTTTDPNNTALTIQVGEQSSHGIEVATVLRPAPRWTVEANATVLQAQYDVYNVGAVSYAGKLPSNVPEKLANLNITWQAAPEWRVGAGARYVGRTAIDDANTVYADAYTMLNAWVGWKIGKGELFLRGRNLTDKIYVTRAYGTQPMFGEPRAFELSYYERF